MHLPLSLRQLQTLMIFTWCNMKIKLIHSTVHCQSYCERSEVQLSFVLAVIPMFIVKQRTLKRVCCGGVMSMSKCLKAPTLLTVIIIGYVYGDVHTDCWMEKVFNVSWNIQFLTSLSTLRDLKQISTTHFNCDKVPFWRCYVNQTIGTKYYNRLSAHIPSPGCVSSYCPIGRDGEKFENVLSFQSFCHSIHISPIL